MARNRDRTRCKVLRSDARRPQTTGERIGAVGAAVEGGKPRDQDGLNMTLMRWWDVKRLRIRSLARRNRADEELSRELLFHIEQETREYVARGMPLEEAQRAA